MGWVDDEVEHASLPMERWMHHKRTTVTLFPLLFALTTDLSLGDLASSQCGLGVVVGWSIGFFSLRVSTTVVVAIEPIDLRIIDVFSCSLLASKALYHLEGIGMECVVGV